MKKFDDKWFNFASRTGIGLDCQLDLSMGGGFQPSKGKLTPRTTDTSAGRIDHHGIHTDARLDLARSERQLHITKHQQANSRIDRIQRRRPNENYDWR